MEPLAVSVGPVKPISAEAWDITLQHPRLERLKPPSASTSHLFFTPCIQAVINPSTSFFKVTFLLKFLCLQSTLFHSDSVAGLLPGHLSFSANRLPFNLPQKHQFLEIHCLVEEFIDFSSMSMQTGLYFTFSGSLICHRLFYGFPKIRLHSPGGQEPVSPSLLFSKLCELLLLLPTANLTYFI